VIRAAIANDRQWSLGGQDGARAVFSGKEIEAKEFDACFETIIPFFQPRDFAPLSLDLPPSVSLRSNVQLTSDQDAGGGRTSRRTPHSTRRTGSRLFELSYSMGRAVSQSRRGCNNGC
jgi:hypothetical protein